MNPKGAPHSQRPLQIVSLVPSLTETVAALGLGPHIVGCTSFCVSPKEISRKARIIGGTKDPNVQIISQLNPTHILANTEENRPPCLEALRKACPHALVWETHPRTVNDSIDLVHHAADLFAPWHAPAQDAANRWAVRVSALREKIQVLREQRAADRKLVEQNHSIETETFLYLIWRDPWMAAGDKTYISSLLAEGGFQNTIVTGNGPTERYPILDPLRSAPWAHASRVLFSSEPYHFLNRHMDLFCTEFASFGDFSNRVMKVDGKALSWFGTSTLDGLDEVLRIMRSSRKQQNET